MRIAVSPLWSANNVALRRPRVQGLRDPHARVRWAACQAVGQLCTDLGPELQEAEHARLLPGLMAVMDDFGQPRVQAHAAAALVNFSENCEQVRVGAGCVAVVYSPRSLGCVRGCVAHAGKPRHAKGGYQRLPAI